MFSQGLGFESCARLALLVISHISQQEGGLQLVHCVMGGENLLKTFLRRGWDSNPRVQSTMD